MPSGSDLAGGIGGRALGMKFSPAGATHFVPIDEHEQDQAKQAEPPDREAEPRDETED